MWMTHNSSSSSKAWHCDDLDCYWCNTCLKEFHVSLGSINIRTFLWTSSRCVYAVTLSQLSKGQAGVLWQQRKQNSQQRKPTDDCKKMCSSVGHEIPHVSRHFSRNSGGLDSWSRCHMDISWRASWPHLCHTCAILDQLNTAVFLQL